MRKNLGSLLWGSFLILIGLGYLGNVFDLWKFQLFFDGWWTLFIIVPCLINMVENGVHIGNSIGVILGALLLLSAQGLLDSDTIGKLIFPVILVGIGIAIIVKSFNNKTFPIHNQDGIPQFTAIFGGQEYRFTREKFIGAKITAIFGGIDLNLMDAVIEQDIVIDSTTVFGGADILVPSNVKVKIDCIPIFGGVSNKSISNNDENAPTIYLKSTCIFGGIDIK